MSRMGNPKEVNPYQVPSGQVPDGQVDPDKEWRELMFKLYSALNEAELTAQLDAIVQKEGNLWRKAFDHLVALMRKEQQKLQEQHQKTQPSWLGKINIFSPKVESDFRDDPRGRQYDAWSVLISRLQDYKPKKVGEV